MLWSTRVHPDFSCDAVRMYSAIYISESTGCSDCQIVNINIAERYRHIHKTSPRLQSGCVQAGLMLADKGVTSPNNTNLTVKRNRRVIFPVAHLTEITLNNQKRLQAFGSAGASCVIWHIALISLFSLSWHFYLCRVDLRPNLSKTKTYKELYIWV